MEVIAIAAVVLVICALIGFVVFMGFAAGHPDNETGTLAAESDEETLSASQVNE
jgi:hypothetical protein